ncbi:UNVERIFIED_CONTAM: hypothetical protein Sradi_2811900 [Sesamum radiatum]|uniref:Armadillo repeat-containing protein 6 n=1 Tax=Sesamum radiatum TaxID=300843 RepID=A0AAW2RXH5_SESRA
MGPAKAAARTISQQAFDEMVQENIDDLGMDPTEALEDAIQTLTLQGVDLSGIVTCVPGESNPVMECLGKLREEKTLPETVELLDELSVLCSDKASGNAAIATKNGAVELVISICSKLRDLQSSETFKENDGPKIVVGILTNESEDVKILDGCFSVVAAAATGNEVLKESFMDLKIDELIVKILKEHNGESVPSIYDAIRVILSSDDNRVVASQVFGYARKFAKLGIADILVDSLRAGLSSPCLISASIALKAVAVNDEILLLFVVEGSDVNKGTIVEMQGMDRLVNLSARFSDDPLVLQEGGIVAKGVKTCEHRSENTVLVMSIICTLCLRSPENAARAIESGAGDLAIQAMQKFPQSDQLQRSSCS